MKGGFTYSLILISLFGYSLMIGQENQITIDRVELMPNEPSPYNTPDWRTMAQKYDAFVYDIEKTGEYLPLISMQSSGVNYENIGSFGMHSYVGTANPNAGEAINILPSLVGATLSGIDKSDQNGKNWILMSQNYFNKKNGELLYLNGRSAHSGNDWWYDMMPNIYFYQLYDLYGEIGDAAFQFNSVANRCEEAVRAMGGSATPWNKAFFEHRAWDFINMIPNDDGVNEPEAAGAYAWLLYHAYNETGNPEYLKGAEWSIEFLHNLGYNPSYELQLPYGAFIAAKMNAEINTNYNIEKFMYWIFNRGAIRGWGTIVGNWGGLDVSGLVGEANDGGNDYAFQMNGVQHAAALVPLVRYDKRFSRAVAKWFLNLANATRLMYPNFLPSSHQDGSEWSQEYDLEGVIGYESMKEKLNGLSPFATGDALRGGWAGTNLALYGSSSIGYLGALYEETNQEKILLIDLLKTDFLNDEAYPSFLLFNPFPGDREVIVDVGSEPVDIYDVISETFLLEGVSGEVSITLKSDEVRSLVYAPPGGAISFMENRMLINDVVVDYDQHLTEYNVAPRIQALATENYEVEIGDTINVYGTATDPETKDLTYVWDANGGNLSGEDDEVLWIAPETEGSHEITLIVWDDDQNSDTAVITLNVVAEVNIPPVILALEIEGQYVQPAEGATVRCLANDENGDELSYTWSANGGSFDGTGSSVFWNSPALADIYIITVEVKDDKGGSTSEQIKVLVQTFEPTSGDLIAHYPFDGNAQDISGNALHGDVSGAKLTDDRFGNPQSAYFFDGNNDHISSLNDNLLNFTKGVTISCWVKPMALPPKETFIISHGSWQNRWKVSITPDKYVRWTLKSSTGQIRDLDSQTQLEEDQSYHVTVSYDGSLLLLYINGIMESFTTMSGDINTTDFDLEIGQMLPDVQEHNFRGVLDEVKIYDYAIHPDTIAESIPASTFKLNQFSKITIHPNPTTDQLTIDFDNSDFDQEGVRLTIFDRSGILIKSKQHPFSGEQIQISTKELTAGIYFLEIIIHNKHKTVKFIKLE